VTDSDRLECIDLFDAFDRRAGALVIGDPRIFGAFPDGEFDLESGSLIFEVSCYVVITGSALTGIRVGDKVVAGDVQFMGTQGVILERKGNEITVNFTGEPYYGIWRKDALGQSPSKNRWVSRLVVRVINDSLPIKGEFILGEGISQITSKAQTKGERWKVVVGGTLCEPIVEDKLVGVDIKVGDHIVFKVDRELGATLSSSDFYVSPTEYTLVPDVNGNIHLFVNSFKDMGEALRISGREGQLDVRLAHS